MGLSIFFTGAADGDDGPFSLASASGWALFGEWADSLEGAPAVQALADNGLVKGTDQLSEQLETALLDSPPDQAAVAETARSLLEMVGLGDKDETAVVTDGEGPDDHDTGDFAEKGGQFRKGGGRVAAGPHTETTKALLAAHPVPADRGTPEGARGWRRSVAAQAAHDVLHAGPVREVPPDPGNPVKAALHAAAVHDAAEFHRDMLRGLRADEVAASHPAGKAAVDEARRVAGDRHRQSVAQLSERLGELARSLPAPADRPLARADLGKGHVIEPGQVDEALRPAVEHLAARVPHATAGDAAVAVAGTPEARRALLVLRQLGAVQPLGEGTAEARAARERVMGSLTDEDRKSLRGGTA